MPVMRGENASSRTAQEVLEAVDGGRRAGKSLLHLLDLSHSPEFNPVNSRGSLGLIMRINQFMCPEIEKARAEVG